MKKKKEFISTSGSYGKARGSAGISTVQGFLYMLFLTCSMLFLAGGCGGAGGDTGGGPPVDPPEFRNSCSQDQRAPLVLIIDLSNQREEDPQGVLRVTAALDSPAPSGGTRVTVDIELKDDEGNRIIDLREIITIGEGETAATRAITVTTDRAIIEAVNTIVFSAESDNPVLSTECALENLGGPSSRPPSSRPPTRPNPVQLEFRPNQLGTANPPHSRNYRRTDEFDGHYGLESISADEAYMRGYFGQGVTIAIAEDGLDASHPDLVGRVRDQWHIRNQNAVVGETCGEGGGVTGGICTVGGAGHGTYVALIAAGASGNGNPDDTFEITLDGGSSVIRTRNVHGVAPQASITSISMSGGAEPGEAVDYAVRNDVQVLNFSIGIGAPPTFSAPASCQYGRYDGKDGVWLTCKSFPYFRPLLVEDLGRYTSRLTGEFADMARTLEGEDIVLVWAAGNDGWNSESDFRVPICGKNRIKPDEGGCPLGEFRDTTKQEFMENFRWIYDADNPENTVSFREMWGTECGEDNCIEYNSPGGWKEAPRFEPELLGKWLVVAASDENGRIADFSNGCGAARNWCLVAPGDNLTVNPPGEEGIDGTSFAAPMVSGALAVLKSRFRDMPMEVIQAILLVSADPVGEREMNPEKPDPVYGWGRLNLGSATALQGDVRLPYSVLDMAGAMRGISPGDYRSALVYAFAQAGAGQGGSLYRGQCASPYEIIRRYRSELAASGFWRTSG